MKGLAFNALSTPNKDSGLSRLQSACIEGDVETVSAIVNFSPDKLDSAIAFSLKIGQSATNFAGKSIYAVLRQQVSEKHKQISEFVENATKNFQSQSLLHLAAKKGQVEHLRRLLDCGEHVDTPSPDLCELKKTPLMLAARYNEEDVVDFLAERGASLDMQDAERYTVLHHAVMGGKSRNVLRLIELGADVVEMFHERAVHLAAEHGHKDVVRVLLEHGASVNCATDDGITPLMYAAQKGHMQIIELMMTYGGDLAISDEFYWLPVHYAAKAGHTNVVKFIAEADGNLSARTYPDGDTLLHLATRVEVVQYLVEKGADIHARNNKAKTPLHSAAENGQSDIISYLINQGADINARDEYGSSALVFAVRGGHTAACKVLIESGCDPFINGDIFYDSVFDVAAAKGMTEILQLLLDRGLSDAVDAVNRRGETPLMQAARAGHCDTVSFLVDHGADVNGRNSSRVISVKGSCVDHKDSEEDEHVHTKVKKWQHVSPLYFALEAGQTELAKLLIQRGADTSNSDSEDFLQFLSHKNEFNFDNLESGETLLTSVVRRKDYDSIPLLLEKGVNVNETNMSGDTALSCILQFATSTHAMEIAKLLLKFGADINIRNDRFETPLQIACPKNFDKVAELLLEHGCETSVDNISSHSPLYHAAQNNNGKLVEKLLQYGADANIKAKGSFKPLHEAATSESVHAAQMLLEHGVQLEVKDSQGRTPLANAAAKGSLPMVQLILKHGGSVYTKDAIGKTPLMLATGNACCTDTSDEHVAIVKTLLDHGSTVNATDECGRSPLHCLQYTTRECWDLLLQYGADLNLPDVNKETPLHFVASHHDTDCTEWFLQQGAKVGALDRENRTPPPCSCL